MNLICSLLESISYGIVVKVAHCYLFIFIHYIIHVRVATRRVRVMIELQPDHPGPCLLEPCLLGPYYQGSFTFSFTVVL